MPHRLLLVEVANYKVVTILALSAAIMGGRAILRHRRSWLQLILAAVIGVLCFADTVNTHYGYLPQVGDVLGVTEWQTVSTRQLTAVPISLPASSRRSDDASGAVLSLPVSGAASGFGRHHVLIALPPQYFTQQSRHFPVVYLLHGSPGRPEDWLRANRLLTVAHRSAEVGVPMIFVMPPMSRGWLDDSECVNGRRERIDTWLVDDVVPAIDKVLRTIPDRQHRALAGVSAGGYCALNLTLRHSDLFAAAVDMSGYVEPTYDGGLSHLFGPDWRAAAAMNTPSRYIDSHTIRLPLHIRFDVGRADARPRREINQLLPRLSARGVNALLVIRPGGHTYHAWVPALQQGLDWLATLFGGNDRRAGNAPSLTSSSLFAVRVTR